MASLKEKIKNFFCKDASRNRDLPALCKYVIDERTEEICGAIMQQVGDEWICTRDDKHRYPMNYSNPNFFPALCAYIINDDTGEICGEVMQQLGDDYVCIKNNNHKYKIKKLKED